MARYCGRNLHHSGILAVVAPPWPARLPFVTSAVVRRGRRLDHRATLIYAIYNALILQRRKRMETSEVFIIYGGQKIQKYQCVRTPAGTPARTNKAWEEAVIRHHHTQKHLAHVSYC